MVTAGLHYDANADLIEPTKRVLKDLDNQKVTIIPREVRRASSIRRRMRGCLCGHCRRGNHKPAAPALGGCRRPDPHHRLVLCPPGLGALGNACARALGSQPIPNVGCDPRRSRGRHSRSCAQPPASPRGPERPPLDAARRGADLLLFSLAAGRCRVPFVASDASTCRRSGRIDWTVSGRSASRGAVRVFTRRAARDRLEDLISSNVLSMGGSFHAAV